MEKEEEKIKEEERKRKKGGEKGARNKKKTRMWKLEGEEEVERNGQEMRKREEGQGDE